MTKPKAKVRKLEAEKDQSGSSSGVDQKQTTEGFPGASSRNPASASAWFTTEIQAMMHGFGDCSKPLMESAKLIEEVVHQQMNSLLLQLQEIALNRGVRIIGLEDIIFLLRKDKVKLSRLLRYLNVKDLKGSTSLKSAEDVLDEGDGTTNPNGVDGAKVASPVKKRVKLCQDFISLIDQTGELLSLFDEELVDEVKLERDLRADFLTQSMDLAQYLEFAEARRTTFARKYRSTKFRDWILKDNLVDIKPNTIALEILNYLAYETVAQVVDLALLVKQDANAVSDDPVSRTIVPQCFNHNFPSIRLHQVTKSEVSTASTPPQSPRFSSPPVSPTATAPSTASQQSKFKAKKRKKSGGHVSLELPYSQVIHPADIREAIRRYWYPIGPLVPFTCDLMTPFISDPRRMGLTCALQKEMAGVYKAAVEPQTTCLFVNAKTQALRKMPQA